MKLKLRIVISGFLSLALCFCFFFLCPKVVSADEAGDDMVMASVPASCSMTASGMNSHTATVPSGTVNSSIGETTINVFCNDYEGFAVYAIGYTDDTNGNNVLTNSEVGSTYDIETGLATSGNTSNWAMKLSTITSPTPTYPITIESDQSGSFSSFHTVPDDYTKVAKRTSATDVGQNAEGSTIKTTYQAYVSVSQLTGTYTGKVKYLLVHPNYVDKSALSDAITVVFDGNGLTFPDGSTTNTVKYANVCKPGGTGYVGTNYQEVMTSNITTGGTQNGAYAANESVLQPVTINGADKLKVVVNYDITSGFIYAMEGDWDGNGAPDNYEEIVTSGPAAGTKTVLINSDTVTMLMLSDYEPTSEHNYGMYVRIYPVYNTEQDNTTYEELPSNDCSVIAISGGYMETDPWKGKWSYTGELPLSQNYSNEEGLKTGLSYAINEAQGQTITLYAYNPYTLKYNGNGASNEFGMGTHHYRASGSWSSELTLGQEIALLAPNYKRSGYGFIGWSPDVNAASHISTATIYGPQQDITITQDLANQANSSREITLYAVWVPSAGNIQNWSGCSSMNTGSVTALTDTRDNDTYAVAKLADGNCWMIENLRLGGDSSMTLTTSDTQSAGVLPAAVYGSNWVTNSYVGQISAINTSSPEPVVENIHQNNYAYGNHYSWYAAANITGSVSGSGNAMSSICPSGWKIPTQDDYYNAHFQSISRSFPNNFVHSGFISSVNDVGMFDNYSRSSSPGHRKVLGRGQGFYWTSSYWSASDVSFFHCMQEDSISAESCSVSSAINISFYGTDGRLQEGYAVRCIVSTSN